MRSRKSSRGFRPKNWFPLHSASEWTRRDYNVVKSWVPSGQVVPRPQFAANRLSFSERKAAPGGVISNSDIQLSENSLSLIFPAVGCVNNGRLCGIRLLFTFWINSARLTQSKRKRERKVLQPAGATNWVEIVGCAIPGTFINGAASSFTRIHKRKNFDINDHGEQWNMEQNTELNAKTAWVSFVYNRANIKQRSTFSPLFSFRRFAMDG